MFAKTVAVKEEYDSKVAHKLLRYCRKNISVSGRGGAGGLPR